MFIKFLLLLYLSECKTRIFFLFKILLLLNIFFKSIFVISIYGKLIIVFKSIILFLIDIILVLFCWFTFLLITVIIAFVSSLKMDITDY